VSAVQYAFPRQLLNVEANLDFRQIADALYFVDRGAAHRAQGPDPQSRRTFDRYVRDAEICFARGTALEAVKLRGFAFASFPGLACIQKADQFFSPYQKGALVFVRLQTLFDPSQHGILMNAEQHGYLLHGIGPCRLDQAYVVSTFAWPHGETHAVVAMPLLRVPADDPVPMLQIKPFSLHTVAFRPTSAMAMLSAVIAVLVALRLSSSFAPRVSPRSPGVVLSKHANR
jgi:hypothetical protein